MAWTLTGTYEVTEEGISRFQLDDCNEGHFPGSGSGTIDGEQINVSFRCTTDDHGSAHSWNNVVLTRQSGGASPDASDEEADQGETGQVDEDDFGQDPNRIKEGETDGNITVDRLFGDATVSKDSTYPSRHLITTGSRSKAKIHFGDSEIVIGPNSKLRVNTTENKFGQPVIMWEFLNPEAVIYVKDKLHGTREEVSGVHAGGDMERVYTNLWRSIAIFYNGSYYGKKDLNEFYGGETNQPEFTDPDTGERSVIVGIRGTEYYYQATESGRTMFLTEGEIDLYTDADDKLVTLAAGEKVPVDEDGAIGPATSYTSAEVEALAMEVELEQPVEDAADAGRLSTTAIVAIAAAGLAIIVLAVTIILILRKRKNQV
ncbi:MAG: FecR family protein [Thermoleophilia bacterium]